MVQKYFLSHLYATQAIYQNNKKMIHILLKGLYQKPKSKYRNFIIKLPILYLDCIYFKISDSTFFKSPSQLNFY